MHVQGNKNWKDLREGEPQMETRILETSINKICSLLAVGFGDAGAEVLLSTFHCVVFSHSLFRVAEYNDLLTPFPIQRIMRAAAKSLRQSSTLPCRVIVSAEGMSSNAHCLHSSTAAQKHSEL